ncbi:MAG: lipoyl(octanoyl) transferase LipB [Desulfobacterales bacterium]|nr:lipoyl(octanoyl) transferase LipB [Desulfobacterales bacterium]
MENNICRALPPDPQAGSQPIDIRHMAMVDYDQALFLQKELAEKRSLGQIPDTLLLLEHPPTYTLGVRGGRDHFLVPVEELQARGAIIRRADRGGLVTFHGPGQVVGYPVMDVHARFRDITEYVHCLEQVVIETLAAFDICAGRIAGYRGVWTRDRKIAAVGIRVDASGISSHGFALNANTDLWHFEAIVACGIAGKAVTSMAAELNQPVDMEQIYQVIQKVFLRIFHGNTKKQDR